MIYPTTKILLAQADQISNSENQSGVTLLLSILVLSAIMAISFSLATILLVEVRVSGDLLRTEPAIYVANAVTEEALFTVRRGYPRCTGTCTNQFYYSSKLGAVNLNPAPKENPFNFPILVDKVVSTSNSITNTQNRYAFYDPANINAPGNFKQVKVTYKDTGVQGKIHVYVCEFDAPQNFSTTAGPIDCNTPNSTDMLYQDTTNGLNEGQSTALITLNPNKQQELIIYAELSGPTPTADRYVKIEAFDAGGVAKGIPFFGETAVDIHAQYGGVTRALRVRIPDTNTSSGAVAGANVSSVSFDGNNDYTSAPLNGTTLTQLTVSFWINPSNTVATQRGIFRWIDQITSITPFILVGRQDSGLGLRFHIDGNYLLATPNVNNGQWAHVAVTLDTSNMWRFYVNGSEIGFYPDNSTHNNQSLAQNIFLGSGAVGNFPGWMDDVRIWNVAKSAAQISAEYTSPGQLTGSEPGLIGYWTYNENTGATAANSVGGGNAATLQSGATWTTNKPF